MSASSPEMNEVWQEADGTFLYCHTPGQRWIAFGAPSVEWNSHRITYPLRRIMTADNQYAPEFVETLASGRVGGDIR